MDAHSRVLTVEKLVEGGWGLARLDSEVVLLRGVLPREKVTVADAVEHKGYREAKVCALLEASPDRVAPPCPVYGVCGGCQFQHMGYEAQLDVKKTVLAETLWRLGKVHVENISLPIPSPHPFGYRSTVRFVVFLDEKTFKLGFHQEHSHRPVEASGCLLAPEAMRVLISTIAERLRKQPRLPLHLESMEIRRSVTSGSHLLIHRAGPAGRDQAMRLVEVFADLPDVVGQVVSVTRGRQGQRWVQGQDWIAEELDGVIFHISDRSFLQPNWHVNRLISRTLSEWVEPDRGPRILELYAGVGTLGLPLARRGALVTEVEANRYAIADGRHAAKRNHVGRCRFRHLRAEAAVEGVGEGEYDLVVVDPPRTGLSPGCLQGLLRIAVPRLMYISCNAATLARDLSRLCVSGYRIARVQPFDMFPQTAHVETLVELVR